LLRQGVRPMAFLPTPRQRVQHLLRRAGFGYSAAELEEYVRLGVDGTVDRLLNPAGVDDSATDATVTSILTAFATIDPMDQDLKRAQREALFRAWYVRMTASRRPLLERMTYFWHDHFATALAKVDRPDYMQRQNDTIRANALGSFRDLLLSVARDPAMLVYLDNRSNVKARPNENYARELLELHTLGQGNGYTETDIKETARALTGWRIENGDAIFTPSRHDTGEKTVLGKRGAFDEIGIVDLLAAHPGTAEYVCDKLVRFFVRPDGDAALARRAADRFMATGGNIREVMRTILLADEMYSAAAYRSQIKSPTELIVGAERALELATDGRGEIDVARRMGQLLYEPPNPAGWTGGPEWVNATTMLARSNFANDITGLRKVGADVPALLRKYGATVSATAVVDFVLDLLVGGDANGETRAVLVEHAGGEAHFNFEEAARDGRLNGVVYLALSMPLYQVA
jgi:uncharacterized protein (DUF1800 family)